MLYQTKCLGTHPLKKYKKLALKGEVFRWFRGQQHTSLDEINKTKLV